MKTLLAVLALLGTAQAFATSPAEKSYFQRSGVFSYLGEGQVLGSKTSVFFSKAVQTGAGERRASVAWAFRETIQPSTNISVDSTEWMVTVDCIGRVIAFERFEDGDSFGRIRRVGPGAFWVDGDSEGFPQPLLPDLFVKLCEVPGSNEPVTALAIGSKEPRPALYAAPSRREPVIPRQGSAGEQERERLRSSSSTGTGFFVSDDLIITNEHVVSGCSVVDIRRHDGHSQQGRVLNVSERSDLATVKVGTTSTEQLRLRPDNVEVGETIVTFGFPLSGLLSDGGVATTGIVSALSGIKNDASRIQITAPIQPGNSGGPVLDERGQIVGVVVSKLNALRIAEAIGDVPQNVNFAVSLDTLRVFLGKTKSQLGIGTSQPARNVKEIVRSARSASVLVTCSR